MREDIRVWGFGSDKVLADALKNLVLSGEKTGTTGLYQEGKAISKVGECAAIVDADNKPFCIITYINIEVKPFLEVTYDFAVKEGEGDKTIEDWRKSHRDFFMREYPDTFSEHSLVVCEEFILTEILS